MSEEDEWRFSPEDFDESGDVVESRNEATPAPLVIVGSFGLGLALFFAAPFVEPITVLGKELELRTVSAFVFATGLSVGSSMYLRQGNRLLGTIHAFGALGWVFLGFGTLLSNSVLLVAGGGLLVAGAAALIASVLRTD